MAYRTVNSPAAARSVRTSPDRTRDSLPRSFQASGLGAAIHGAVAARCYPDFPSAIAAMAGLQETRYRPDADAGAVYTKPFAEYVALHDYFGRVAKDVMKRLKELRRQPA